jgi:farnesyl diphosphate synthase
MSNEQASFEAVGASLVEEALGHLRDVVVIPNEEEKHVRRMLEYNVKGGKMNRGLMVVTSGLKIFESQGREANSDTRTKLAVLGWCVEWLQAWILVADDIMGCSETRRGRPCWHKQQGVGPTAINDAFMLEMLVFQTLKRHFWQEPYYHQLVDLFLETTFQTECGQLLDLRCTNIPLEHFTEDRWNTIVKYKAAFYSFYCPVALGMIVAGITDKNAYDVAREPLLKMGIYFQAHAEFGTVDQIGNASFDIQDKKCDWLFIQAFSNADEEGKQVLKDHYDNCTGDSAQEGATHQLYQKFGLRQLCEDYDNKSFDEIMALKSDVEKAKLPWSMFEEFLLKVYRRNK